MKPLHLFFLTFLVFSSFSFAQTEYAVDGKNYVLKTEVSGKMTLLWNTINGEYRYFIQKNDEIFELKNTQSNGDFNEEYKQTLQQLTADAPLPAEDVRFTLADLRTFVNEYNKRVDPSFTENAKPLDIQLRLGIFGGISNAIFTENPTNQTLPVGGADFEIFDAEKLKRHAIVLRFKQTFQNEEYQFSSSQFSLNYRFKFVKSPRFDAFVNAKFAAFTSVKRENVIVGVDGTDVPILGTSTGSDFNAPFTFGLGADYKVGNGYITFTYNDVVGLNVDSNGEFPLDFTLGYKFNL
ncbi:hypothetical protein [Aequorivita echinoideorum]|uniref:Outer membrane protein beta-barrel domain-containing protein n=1 Tax=Aequorivita echinoideorum TaxID=1549647 RepID=A0ABS5S2X6_9FLAO|nr:hypothetical protein [Aequorivita echinoideorum]MBT0606810.1 hypothetical protein [Aequorivita echinoideorum]